MYDFIWLIMSVVILITTIWVHHHTYGVIYEHGKWVVDLDDPEPFPMWLLLSMIAISFIPIINVIMFTIGMMAWIINYVEDDIRLGNLPKWSKSVQKFLTKEVFENK